ncbi:MAG TPA: hypothetical protein VF339_11800 [Gammaproteobacteria bacterium]
MKYVWMTIAGCIVGAVVGGALLLFNPLTASGNPSLVGFDRTLRYVLPDDALVLTHSGVLPIERRPFEVEPLWESAIRSTSLATLVLRGESDAPHAIATRITAPSKRTDLLTTGVLANDHWLVSIPTEGTFFVVAETNVSTIARDTFVAVQLLGREWQGRRTYLPIEGPEIAGTARVVGASGSFADRVGRALERYEVERFARGAGLERASAELYLALDEAPQAGDAGADQGSAGGGDAPAGDGLANENAPAEDDSTAGGATLAGNATGR